MNFVNKYLDETIQIVKKLNTTEISKVIKLIKNIKRSKGRIFFIGAGGSAGNCSHAVNDFRKIVGIECYAPTDNVSELTARTNDEGWDTVFEEWLKISKLSNKDMIFVFNTLFESDKISNDMKKSVWKDLIYSLSYE